MIAAAWITIALREPTETGIADPPSIPLHLVRDQLDAYETKTRQLWAIVIAKLKSDVCLERVLTKVIRIRFERVFGKAKDTYDTHAALVHAARFVGVNPAREVFGAIAERLVMGEKVGANARWRVKKQ